MLNWLIENIVSILALAISISTAIYTYKHNLSADNKELLTKKTEIIITVNELNDLMSELLCLYLQKIVIFQADDKHINSIKGDLERLYNNIDLLREKRLTLSNMVANLKKMTPTDLVSMHEMTADFGSWLNNIKVEIRKEQSEWPYK